VPITPQLLEQIDSFESLASKLFHDELRWPTRDWQTFSGVPKLYGLTKNDISGIESLAAVQKFKEDQDWGIFLVDFANNPLKRSDLRKVLNKVAERARAQHDNPTWPHEKILFICRSENNNWTFAYFTGDKLANAKLRRFGWENPLEARTAVENLNKLEWGKDWSAAFDVEKLTKDFFTKLSDLFFDAMQAVKTQIADENERRLFVQTLFNRLIFLRFVEKKGWLQLNGREDYLRALWEASKNDHNPFWPTRLNALFGAVNHPLSDKIHKNFKPLIGEVQYLNGGLFDEDHRFADPNIKIPNQIFEGLLGEDGLFYRYNFTVEESTPLDVNVAVDPEILGKIFEQLTIATKRHDTGSYYTPREIVQFMCREALVGYLEQKGLTEEKARKLVYDHDDSGLTNQEGNLAFEALKAIKVVDPACGSGAYLLGMLQELYALFELLRRDDRKFSTDPAQEAHERKLWIIENNLYGVDIQQFATNTAMLRLWLTLLVEDTGTKPQPLPNLEYKIETGDSLLGPDPSQPIDWSMVQRGLDFEGVHETVEHLRLLRERYQSTHGPEKNRIKTELEAKLAELREKVTGSPIKDPNKFDWRVEFFDVFLDDPAKRKPGFDAVVMNPPYIATYSRQSEHLESEPELRRLYGKFGGRVNLFTCFLIRMHEVLLPSGQGAFIVPDTFATSDSYNLVRKFLFRFHPNQIWILLRDGAFGATVRNVIVVVGAGEHATTSIVLDQADDIHEAVADAPAPIFGSDRISFFRDQQEKFIWSQVSGQSRTLEELCIIRDGVNPGAKVTRAKLLATAGAIDARPLIEGTDIDPNGYRISWRGELIRYSHDLVTPEEKKRGTSLRDPAVFQSPKLVSRQTADTLIFALDLDQNYVGLNSVHFSRAIDGDTRTLYALLMLLNSPLARLFYALDGGETRDILPQVHIAWLRKFPIPEKWDEMKDLLAAMGEEVVGRETPPFGVLLRAHAIVCAGYGLEANAAEAVLSAFARRYPRFAGAFGLEF
jgi:type I restriction-modification system DNA methylase subunit